MRLENNVNWKIPSRENLKSFTFCDSSTFGGSNDSHIPHPWDCFHNIHFPQQLSFNDLFFKQNSFHNNRKGYFSIRKKKWCKNPKPEIFRIWAGNINSVFPCIKYPSHSISEHSTDAGLLGVTAPKGATLRGSLCHLQVTQLCNCRTLFLLDVIVIWQLCSATKLGS